MRSKKKLALLLSTILCALFLVLGMAACNNGASAKEAIDLYILPQNETLVSEDFTLPKKIGKNDSVSVKWTSSNTDAIAIEDNGENYKAKVTLQGDVTPVTLTISSGSASKNFTVRVDGLSVYTFLDNFVFKQENTAVKQDFDLETSTSYQGKTAEITWNIPETYRGYATLNEAKNKVIVSEVEEIKTVVIEATFHYNDDEATQPYSFSVAPPLEHRQTVNYYYSVAGYPLELSGYIVHVFEASESYGNATFYMIDDDFCSGYYCYRVKIDKEAIDKYVAGAHVTVTNDTTKNYNGLWENNSGGTATVDDKDPIDPREYVYAFDTDLLSGVPSALWHESTFISLSGWKVVDKAASKPTGSDSNLFALERDGVKITVRVSKYIQRTDAELQALLDVYDKVENGKFVNVTGILGYYNAFQIQPILASDIEVVTAEGTNTDGAAVKAAVAKVQAEVEKNFSSLVTSDAEFTMPTSESGVTISYKVAGAVKEPTVTIDGGKFTVKPVETEKNYDIEVTYKIGDYEAYGFFKLRNIKASASDLLKLAKENIEKIELAEVKNAGSVTIPEVDLYGASVTWEIENKPEWVSIENGVVTVSELPAAAAELTLKAHLTLGSETETAELTLKVAAKPAATFQAIDAPAAGDYIFALYQGNLEKWLYSAGTVTSSSSGNFGATTENSADAATYTLTKGTTGWTIQLKSDNTYLELNDKHNICYVAESTQEWAWNEEHKVFTFNVGEDTYYIGTYNTFDTFSASKISYLSGNSNFAAHFGNMSGGSSEPSGEKGTEGNPYTVAEILDLAKDLADGSYLQADGKDAYVYIKGYVTNVGYIYQSYGLSTVMIADEKGGTPEFKLYTVNWGDAMPKPSTIPEKSPLTVGDFVVCHGFVKNYSDEIEVDKDSAKSTYPTFTTWTKAGGSTVDPEPEPELSDPTTGTEIDENGATVFDFSGVAVAGANDYNEMTPEAILTAFDNYEGLTVTSSKVYAGNNNASGPSDYQEKGGFLRMGSGSASGTLTLNFSKDVKKIQILCIGWSTSDTIAIDGFNPATVGNTAQVAYTFELTEAVKSFTITTAKRVLIFKIAVTFADGSTVDPEPAEHVHNYTYTYDTETGWQHKGHCDVEGCNEPEITVQCVPELNVCPDCKHEFTQDEILAKLFASKADSTMSGTYSLTGKVLRIDTVYSSDYSNVTFTMKVGDKEVQCYREKSSYSQTVKPGDTVTVQGSLKHYYDGTKEFDTGCAITKLTAGELTNAEKVSEALRVVTLPASAEGDITLPTSTIEGVQFAWASDTETSIKVEGGKLKVTQTDESVTVKITLTATCGTDASETKEFTIVVDAKLPEGTEKAELKYSGSTGNMTGSNDAKTLGANETIFTVTSEKTNSGQNHVGLNKDGSMRLYKNGTATLHIEVASTYKIISIKVTLASNTPAKMTDLKVVVGSDTITGTGTNSEGTVATFAVNGTKVSLSNTNASNQIYISSIEVIYAPAAPAAAAVNAAPVAILPEKKN